MNKTLKILFVFIAFSFGYAKNQEENIRLVHPRYTPINSSFDISLITSNLYTEAEQLELYIIHDNKINLNEVLLRSFNDKKNIDFSSSILSGVTDPVKKTIINLTENGLEAGAFFQVLFNFKSDNSSGSKIQFYGMYKKGEEILGYLRRGDGSKTFNEQLLISEINFFTPQRTAGRTLQFQTGAQFEFTAAAQNINDFFAEFWIKFSDPSLAFLKIKNPITKDEEFALSLNAFQMLIVESEYDQEFSAPFFIGRNSWYQLSIYFSQENNSISIFANGRLISKHNLQNIFNFERILFEFANLEREKTFSIDLLRFIDLKNSLETAFNNRNYLTFQADSSTVISTFRFDASNDLQSKREKISINTNTAQLVRSDAPIFARAPEININLLSSSYELTWGGGDFKQAATYQLEKSKNNSEFISIFTIQADNASEKKYSFLDKQEEDSEIIYYRIKQINHDGSAVYSSQVKVGQGRLEPFVVGQNYPNPFNPKTSIVVEFLEESEVEITVYNLEGREITKIHTGVLSKGTHTFSFDGKELPSGIYIYKVETPGYTATKKMILAK
jgi:hypothetical protein